MKKPRVHSYYGYKGNWWAIVLGHKDKDIAPLPLAQFVRTASKKEYLDEFREKYPHATVRAIPQPIPALFEPGM
jgi:hypothetical protein